MNRGTLSGSYLPPVEGATNTRPFTPAPGAEASQLFAGSAVAAPNSAWSAECYLGPTGPYPVLITQVAVSSTTPMIGVLEWGTGPSGIAVRRAGVTVHSQMDESSITPFLLPGGEGTWVRAWTPYGGTVSVWWEQIPVIDAPVARRTYFDETSLNGWSAGSFASAPSWSADLPLMAAGKLPEPCHLVGLHSPLIPTYGPFRARIKINGSIVYEGVPPRAVGVDQRGMPWAPVVPAGASVSAAWQAPTGAGSMNPVMPHFAAVAR